MKWETFGLKSRGRNLKKKTNVRTPAPQHQGAKTSKLTPQQWLQVIKERVEEEISPNDLARKWNCSSDTISKLSKLSKQVVKVRKAGFTISEQFKKSPILDTGGSRGF